ncbi:hypothetical protein [Streptomyces aquilus]|uniref:hypothetical protein n=1 Tax=Streptomyces aquilus TaxID=2548456 RepID=UPI0036C6681C
MSAAFIAALTPLGTALAFAVVIVWRLLPGGLPDLLNAWTRYRMTATARELAVKPDESERQTGVDILRAVYGAGGGPETQTVPAAQDQPPARPGDPPP